MNEFIIGELINLKFQIKDSNGNLVDTEQVLCSLKDERISGTTPVPVTRLAPGVYKASINTESLGIGYYDIHIQARGSYQAAYAGIFKISPSIAYARL